jgi:hypothetical protein
MFINMQAQPTKNMLRNTLLKVIQIPKLGYVPTTQQTDKATATNQLP